MNREQLEAELNRINSTLDALRGAWPMLHLQLQSRMNDLVNRLIGKESEQTRGAIKEVRQLIELPQTLQQERESITAALSDMDAANN